MKALTPVLGLFILSILVCNDSMAQKASYTSNGGLTIGFGGGMAYQKSDLANSKGYGFDFILGSQLYKKENAFLSVDWKFRFLAGENKAYDHRINPDDTYSNIRYGFFNYDLELGLTLNRLRERTRIVLTGFAGAGITHGRTFTDLYDAGNNLYEFSSIDPNRDSKLVNQDLVTLSDGNFETDLINKAAVLPTAGLFIGYQLSRSLTLGVEFKTNFYLTEDNSFVGLDLDNKAISGSGFDRNNYISLGFRWSLRGGSSGKGRGTYYSPGGTNNYSTTTYTDNPAVVVSGSQPSVNITDPSADLYHTLSPSHTVRATVMHIDGPDNINFFHNGFPNNTFTYNVNSKSFVANVRLREGENSLRIKATNQVSSAEDLVIITLEMPREVVLPAPRAEFTSPWQRRISSSSDRLEVTASVKNINSKEEIELTQDGRNIPFMFDPVSGLVSTSILLTEGDNNLFIKGFNETGSAQDQLTIDFYYPEEIAPPMVRFVNPHIPVEVNTNRFTMSAETQNLLGRGDLTLSFNGYPINNFSLGPNGAVSANLALLEGVNHLEIIARNEAGTASDRTSITYYPPVYQEPVFVRSYPPVINIIRPGTYPFRTTEQSEELRATIMNVATKEHITLSINGIATRSFNFNSSTKVLTTRVALREGENVLSIYAQNESGEDAKEQLFIKETRSCPPPVIRLIDPAQGQISTDQERYELRAEVRNITNSSQLNLIANGKAVPFTYNNNLVSSPIPLVNGLNTLMLNARNECGEDNTLTRINYRPTVVTVPCTPPTVSITIQEVDRDAVTHELQGILTGVKDKSEISLSVDGRANNGFQFVPATGALNAKLFLTPGSHTVVVTVSNACGTDSENVTTSRQKPCTPPVVAITLKEVNRTDATHELQGSVSGVKNKAGISLTLDGRANNGFQFVPSTGALSAKFKLSPGSHTVVVSANNECGTESKSVSATVEQPCTSPTIAFNLNEVNRADASHELQGSVSGVKNKAGISLTLDGRANNGFQFVPSTGALSAQFKLSPGSHTVVVSANNECGTESKSVSAIVEQPCTLPTVAFNLKEVNRTDATHELQGSVSGVKNKAGISLTLDGRANNGFQFVPSTGMLSAKFKLSPGSHTVVVSANNECGTDSKSASVTIAAPEKPCGIRINPGNSAWQFCLVTPSRTITRDNLTNKNFSYSGPASSIYFMPIGGGGEAMVNGRPHTIKSGQYYLFTGNLEVTVSSKNPGSMGHWSVCVSANRAPASGNGNNRPKSPCEEEKKEEKKKEVPKKEVPKKNAEKKEVERREVVKSNRNRR